MQQQCQGFQKIMRTCTSCSDMKVTAKEAKTAVKLGKVKATRIS